METYNKKDSFRTGLNNMYILNETGGANNGYVENQLKAIESNNRNTLDVDNINNYLPIDQREGRIDPYTEYRKQYGIIENDTIIKTKKTFVNINSKNRTIDPSIVFKESVQLGNDPIQLIKDSRDMVINHNNHSYNVGDKITVTNINTKLITLRTVSTNGNGIEVTEDSEYVRIKYKHGIDSTYADTSIKVTITGIKSNLDSTYINNIPLSFFNRSHVVYLVNSTKPFEEDCFYIKLPRSLVGTYTFNKFNFTIQFNSIGGIQLSHMNARYPIDINNLNGFFIIKSKTTNSYTVEIKEQPIKTVSAGGSNVMVSKVDRIIQGYSDPNSYKMSLPVIFNHVTSIRLISTEFPNSQKVIRNNVNNKIYWQNLDDGDYIYSLSIPSGHYNISTLKTAIEYQFNQVNRISVIETTSYMASYKSTHYVTVDINISTDEVTLKPYKEYELIEPLVGVNPDIQEKESLDAYADGTRFNISIQHANHGLIVGDIVTISGAITHMGLPDSVINGSHTISEIESRNQYTIKLPYLNLESVRKNTKGGNTFTVRTHDVFRLLFTEDDTMGEVLGFRDVGEDHAITLFSKEIKNSEKYEDDVAINQYGNDIEFTNNAINLTGDDYMLMVIKQLNTLVNSGSIDSAFAKIQLDKDPGNYVYNTHISAPLIFPEPMPELHELDIDFFTPDGDLYDFEGLNHSFTVEITTEIENAMGTNISSKTSRIADADDITDNNSVSKKK